MSIANHLDVVVVDDTTTSRALLCAALDEIGIRQRRIAKDGEDALKMMMAKPPHLVMSDFEMPKINGLQLLKGLREYTPTSRVGFILVTGRTDKELLIEGKKLGLNNYLLKPFTTQQLRTCIEAVTGKLG